MDIRYPNETPASDRAHAHLDATRELLANSHAEELTVYELATLGLKMAEVEATLALAEAYDAPLEVTTTHLEESR